MLHPGEEGRSSYMTPCSWLRTGFIFKVHIIYIHRVVSNKVRNNERFALALTTKSKLNV